MNGPDGSLPVSGPDRVAALDWLRWLIACDANRDIGQLVEQGVRPFEAAVTYRDWLCGLISDEVDFALQQHHLMNQTSR